MKKLTLITAILMTANLMFAQVINIPQDYPTIQDGINVADEGDTVLVQPGTYIENLSIFIKNIVLGSLFLTTGDTSYISQTIIDGNQMEPVIRISEFLGNSPDSTCVVAGFTITNGYYNDYFPPGAGICCSGASPTLKNLIISNNHTGESGYGGGIGCTGSSPTIKHVIISGNSAGCGGGMYIINGGNPKLNNVRFTNNSSDYNGVIFYDGSSGDECNLHMDNVIIDNNPDMGIVIFGLANVFLNDVSILDNGWFGICFSGGVLHMAGVRIIGNNGGLMAGGETVFDTNNRCSIYNNYVGNTKDILAPNSTLEVVLDTFTVLNPTAFHVGNISYCTFDILHGFFDQIDADVYVSPSGSDQNSGLTPDEPLKTIFAAQLRLLENNTIFLAGGIYSTSLTGEVFPIQLMNNISLAGVSAADVVLDGSGNTALQLINNSFNKVSGLTLSNGEHGIFMENSYPLIENVQIKNNNSQDDGGGIYMFNSSPILINNIITENSAPRGSGIFCDNSEPWIINSTISNNMAGTAGGGLYCGGESSAFLFNSILWDNNPEQMMILGIYTSNSAIVSYSDIQDGEDGIIISGTGTLQWLEGNINENPIFEGSVDHPYQLSAGSPCIDAGTPGTAFLNLPYTDIMGNIRLWDGDGNGSVIVDMGAYEFGAIPVGVEKLQVQSSKFQVQSYPNPVSENCTIEFEFAKPARISIQIYNNMGELLIEPKNQIYSSGQHQVNLNLIDFKEGIYYCRVQLGNEMVTKKIIKTK